MNSLTVTTTATDEPISLEEAKSFLRVDSSDEDAYVLSLIAAARAICETHTNRHFVTQTVRAYWDHFPDSDTLEVPRPFTNTTALPTLKYFSEGSTSSTTVAASTYWVDADHEPGRIVLRSTQTWPDVSLRTANAVELTLQTGYGSESDVPDAIKHAMRLLIGHWYANREAVLVGTISKHLEYSVANLLGPYVVASVA